MENKKGSSFSTVECPEDKYFRITFETDNRDKFLRMQQTARDCIDNNFTLKTECEHGKWEQVSKSNLYDANEKVVDIEILYKCSKCQYHYEFYWSEKKFNFCPNCGAKMENEV